MLHPAPKRLPLHILALSAVCLGAGLYYLMSQSSYKKNPWTAEIPRTQFEGLQAYGGLTSVAELKRWLPTVDPQQALTPYVILDEARHGVQLHYDAPSHPAVPDAAPPLTVQLRAEAPPTPRRTRAKDPASEDVDLTGLQGLRVLIDPGHFGGAWAVLEQRSLQVPGANQAIQEGDLAHATGQLLAERLLAAGAQVKFTRGRPPTTNFPEGTHPAYDPDVEAALLLNQRRYRPWLRRWFSLYPARIAHWILESHRDWLVKHDRFYLYKRYDLRRRAHMAAQWEPHITLSLHYNMARHGSQNGTIAFMPGHFLAGELRTPSQRYYAIRRLLEGHMTLMRNLGQTVAKHMQHYLGLEKLQVRRTRRHALTSKGPVNAQVGLYARNLAILRRTPGPVLLIEGPCMNHPGESARLLRKDVLVDGRYYPRRVNQYALAVFRALQDYATVLKSTTPQPWRRRRLDTQSSHEAHARPLQHQQPTTSATKTTKGSN